MIRPLPLLTLLLLALSGAGCKPSLPARTSVPDREEQADASWTPERIAADPDAYLQYATLRIDQQVSGRETRLTALGKRKAEIRKRADDLILRVEEARNVQNRLGAAIQRAEDEDRWPLKFANRSFTRDRAMSVREATAQFVKEREPLAEDYRAALSRLDGAERALRADLDTLARMREKLALDLERVRLNQGLAELAELRQTEAQLAGFSATLAGMTDDPLAAPAQSVPDLTVNDLLNEGNAP